MKKTQIYRLYKNDELICTNSFTAKELKAVCKKYGYTFIATNSYVKSF